jgi:hypothetical protein
MTEQEKIKYAYECMVKNNPDEAVKQLLLKDKMIIKKRKTITKAIKLIEDDYFEDGSFENYDEVMKLLRGEDKPQYLGYSDKECINCGRLRVEKYSDGTEICEKCNFDQNKKEYILRGEDNGKQN